MGNQVAYSGVLISLWPLSAALDATAEDLAPQDGDLLPLAKSPGHEPTPASSPDP